MDVSGIRSPGAKGTAWRLHADYDPGTGRFTDLALTDLHEAEGFRRLRFDTGEIALGNRGYAWPRGLQHVLAAGADFIVRVGWYSLRTTTPAGERLDWASIYAGLMPGEVTERQVVVTRRSKALFPAQLIVQRQPLTLASTGYLMVLTSLPAEAASTAEVLAAYRLRWQVELAFKRMKSGLGIGRLLARDRQLRRSWLLAHLILALLLMEETASEVLDAPPVRQAGPARPVSLRRLHTLVRDVLLGAVLRSTAAASLVHAVTLLIRHICDPPRRRLSQAGLARCTIRDGSPLHGLTGLSCWLRKQVTTVGSEPLSTS